MYRNFRLFTPNHGNGGNDYLVLLRGGVKSGLGASVFSSQESYALTANLIWLMPKSPEY